MADSLSQGDDELNPGAVMLHTHTSHYVGAEVV